MIINLVFYTKLLLFGIAWTFLDFLTSRPFDQDAGIDRIQNNPRHFYLTTFELGLCSSFDRNTGHFLPFDLYLSQWVCYRYFVNAWTFSSFRPFLLLRGGGVGISFYPHFWPFATKKLWSFPEGGMWAVFSFFPMKMKPLPVKKRKLCPWKKSTREKTWKTLKKCA